MISIGFEGTREREETQRQDRKTRRVRHETSRKDRKRGRERDKDTR